jgi:KRAB domain-containing zinc finger protein
MRVHQIEDPARCSYCNKNFLRMDCLVRHVRSKHRDTLQQIIVEAETNRIISAQRSTEGEELEIIVYNDDEYKVVEIDGQNIEFAEEEEEEEEECEPIFLDDSLLKQRIQELLEIVIEESLLKELGYGVKPIDEVLCSVLEQCSRTPIRKSDGVPDDSTRMRENTKQLFSMVLDEDHIKSLLNNYTVDEVITIVLKMAK